MQINEKQLALVNRQINRVIEADTFYGKELKTFRSCLFVRKRICAKRILWD